MMNQQPHTETRHHDFALPGACMGCEGAIVVRVTPGSARGVCLACRRIAVLDVERSEDGVRIVQAPAGEA